MEDDEEALKEDEGLPRGTLGTEVCPSPPRNPPSAPTILQSQAEFWGPRARYVTISASLRGGASGLVRPSPANRGGHVADRAAPKNAACNRKRLDCFRRISRGSLGGPRFLKFF